MKTKEVRKAVIPAAGFGTRFLPQTKAMPKEMMPVVDKPVIQYIAEGLVEAGIKDIIIVTGYHKRTIEDHFDNPNQDLLENLRMGGEKKKHLISELEEISNMANFVYVRQKGPYGNGTPLLNVSHLIGDEPFIYVWSDDMILANPGEYVQLIEAYKKYGCSCLSLIKAETDEDYSRYGFISGEELEQGAFKVNEVIEKPGKTNAPSDHATVSSFLLTSEIFDYINKALETNETGAELYYNDALKLMLNDKIDIMGIEIQNGKYYDFGNKLEYLKAVVEFGVKDKDIGDEFSGWLKTF